MTESKIDPDDIGIVCKMLNALIKNHKDLEDIGLVVEMCFITALVLGQRQPELVQEIKNYVKYSRNMTLDKMVEDTVNMLNGYVELCKKSMSES